MKEIRNCIMKFRATEEEKSIIMKKVDASDLSISEYLRRCALDSIRRIIMFDDLFEGMFDFNGDGHTDFAEEATGFAIMEEMMSDEDSEDDFDFDIDSEDDW